MSERLSPSAQLTVLTDTWSHERNKILNVWCLWQTTKTFANLGFARFVCGTFSEIIGKRRFYDFIKIWQTKNYQE